ncbi:FUSC family protein [Halobacillus litoralis]|uniref:FUSC family protein n=1 Tax=Halobacillus litoralis TaxID=45668 RepID=UPI001CD8004C|nr:FUSC family protein [Halobacillus litoralis]MCA1023341.1 FUSC family protein [Halobacillus litoralis]
MKELVKQSYWLRRLLASDPGRRRLAQAGKATLSLVSSVFTTLFLMSHTAVDPLFPAIISGIAGLMGIMIVMDDTKRKKQVTTLLLGLAAVSGVTLGSLGASSPVLVSILMIAAICSAFYFSQHGSRYFSLGMIGFFTIYFSSFLQLSPDQFLWFYLAVGIGILYAFLYNFFIFEDSRQMLRRSTVSFHRQANLTFDLLIEVIKDPELQLSRLKKLGSNVSKLRIYANQVAADLHQQDSTEIWPGLQSGRLRLYIFDTTMFVMTLSESLQKLKEDEALDLKELRHLLVDLLVTLKDADVLDPQPEMKSLQQAEKVVAGIRHQLNYWMMNETDLPDGRLYLIRRIETMASHVTEGAYEVQRDIHFNEGVEHPPAADEEALDEKEEEAAGLKPAEKKAVQALIAGSIAIVTGYIISPIQPYWVLLTAFIIQLGTETVGRTYLKAFERSVGTFFGAFFGFLAALWLSGYPQIEVALLFLVIFTAFYFLTVSYTVASFLITMMIAFIYDLILGGVTPELLGARVLDTVAGAAIALAVSAFVFPTRTKDKLSGAFHEYFTQLSQLVDEYLTNIKGTKGVKGLAQQALDLDAKMQEIEEESKPAVQDPIFRGDKNLTAVLTVITAINYYAKHLVASPYPKYTSHSRETLDLLTAVQDKLEKNLQGLLHQIETGQHSYPVYDLLDERERVELSVQPGTEDKENLLHHLYYIWKINRSITILRDRLDHLRKR